MGEENGAVEARETRAFPLSSSQSLRTCSHDDLRVVETRWHASERVMAVEFRVGID